MTSGPRPGFDVVPFIDAVLITLFVALNTSVFVFAPGTTIQLPASRTLEQIESAPTVVLTVDRNELYFFQGSKLTRQSLQAALEHYVDHALSEDRGAGATLLLKADATIPSSTLFELMDVARSAGFNRILLAAEPGKPQTGAWDASSLPEAP
ncbi:MAG: ExbD/TolR family protein [Oceanipulchritudo sp.]